jgi:hypothetical protein
VPNKTLICRCVDSEENQPETYALMLVEDSYDTQAN